MYTTLTLLIVALTLIRHHRLKSDGRIRKWLASDERPCKTIRTLEV